MSKPLINLVSGDERPDLAFQVINRNTGEVVDLNEASISVFVKFRERLGDVTLADIACEKTDPECGWCKLVWPPTTLDVEAGRYEGEVYVNFGGQVHTDFEILKFKIREGFADVA